MTVSDTVPYALLSLIVAVALLAEAYALTLHLRDRRPKAARRLMRRRIVNWYGRGATYSGREPQAQPANPTATASVSAAAQPQREPSSRPEKPYPAGPLASRRA